MAISPATIEKPSDNFEYAIPALLAILLFVINAFIKLVEFEFYYKTKKLFETIGKSFVIPIVFNAIDELFKSP